jgi:hypothetical protein
MSHKLMRRIPPEFELPLAKLLLLTALAAMLIPVIAFFLEDHRDVARLAASFQSGTFAVISIWLIVIVLFVFTVVWSMGWLSLDRLPALRRFIEHHIAIISVISVLLLLLLLLVSKRLQVDRGLFSSTAILWIQIGLVLWCICLAAALYFLLGSVTLQQSTRHLDMLMTGWQKRIGLSDLGLAVAGLTILSVILGAVTIAGGLFVYPVLGDSSSHIYLGQRLVNGEHPYESFVHFQPPLRLWVTGLWAFTAQLLNAPPLIVGRIYSVVMGIIILIIIYLIAYNMTERPVSALAAAAILVTMNAFFTILIMGPNLKLGTTMMLGLAIVAAQRQRWFWSGIAGGAALLMWFPAGGGAFALLLVALLQSGEQSSFTAAIRFISGIVCICVLTALWLLSMGVLDNFYEQSIVGTWTYVTSRLGPGNPMDGAPTRNRNLMNLLQVVSSWVQGPGLIIVIALPYATWRALRTRSSHLWAPVLVVLVMLVILLLEVQGLPDVITTLPYMVPILGFLLCAVVRAFAHYLDPESQNLRTSFEGIVILFVLIYGLADIELNLARNEQMHLADQTRLAAELDAVLPPGESVQMFSDHLWFLDVTWRGNATRYLWLRAKSRTALDAEGTSFEQIIEEVDAQHPAVIFLPTGGGPDEIQTWVADHYEYLGILQGSGYQRIYVRGDLDGVRAVIETWPLQ